MSQQTLRTKQAIIRVHTITCFDFQDLNFLKHVRLMITYLLYCHILTHKLINLFNLSYGIIFWGNSSYSNTIFKLQKSVIRIMMNAGNRESCRELFKKLNILPLHSQYILSLLLFVVKHINMFKLNSMVHSINPRHCSDLICPQRI